MSDFAKKLQNLLKFYASYHEGLTFLIALLGADAIYFLFFTSNKNMKFPFLKNLQDNSLNSFDYIGGVYIAP